MPGGFFIGPLEIRFYGIIIVSGAVLGAFLASREARRRGHNPDIVWDLLIYLMIGGILGARIWHVFTPMPNILVRDASTGQLVNPYFAGGTIHILDILAIWKGGLGIPGAVIAGALVLFFYSKANQLNFEGRIEAAAINQTAATEAAHLRMMSTVVSGFFRDMDRRLEEMKPKY